MCTRLACAVGTLAVLLSALTGTAGGGEYAPYTYGRWVPVDPGAGQDTEHLAVNPEDPNIVICSSDASGFSLTCDGGQTWAIVNDGIIGVAAEQSWAPPGTLLYAGGPPIGRLKWDPLDANCVVACAHGHLVHGRVLQGGTPRVQWEFRGLLPVYLKTVVDICMDPRPGIETETHNFYVIDRLGQVAFTNDGGTTLYPLARIPFSDTAPTIGGWGGVFYGTQNPLMAVIPYSSSTSRLIAVPCPKGTWYAWALHNQVDPEAYDPNLGDPNDPNVFWNWFDPNDPNQRCGLDANCVGANGLVLVDGGSIFNCNLVLAADNDGSQRGSVYTRNLLDSDWTRRTEFFARVADYTPSSLVVDPVDPNNCYLVEFLSAFRGEWLHAPTGLFRGRDLWAMDPCETYFDAPIVLNDPNTISLGHNVGYDSAPTPCSMYCVDLCWAEPNVAYISNAALGVFRSNDRGAFWYNMYTTSTDPNAGLWSNRGLMPIHTQSFVFSPSDPNIYFIGRNDSYGSFKTENRGKSFWKYLSLGVCRDDCAPEYITYKAGGRTYTHPASWFKYPSRSFADDPNDPNATPNNFWVMGVEANVLSGIIHPSDPNRAWFVTYDEPNVHCSLVVKTTDGGKNLAIVMPDNACLQLDPNDPNIDPNKPSTYPPVPKVNRHFVQMAADPNCTTLYLAATTEGVLRSTDGGDTWTTCLSPRDANVVDPNYYVDPNDPNYGFYTVAVAPGDPNVIYSATGRHYNRWGSGTPTGKGRVYRSADGGATWVETARLVSSSLAAAIHTVVVDPIDPNTVYAACIDWGTMWPATADYGIWKTTNGGLAWERIYPNRLDPKYVSSYVTAIAIDPKDPNTIYCAERDRLCWSAYRPRPGIYFSRDAGNTWAMVGDPNCHDSNDPNFPLTNVITTYYSLSFHPKTGDLYVGTSAGAFWWPRDRTLKVGACKGLIDPNDPNNRGGGYVYINGTLEDSNNPRTLTYANDTQVTLDAVPEPNMKFWVWGGNLPAGADPCDPQIVVLLNEDREIWACFAAEGCGSGLGLLAGPWMAIAAISMLSFGRWYHRRRR